MRKISKEQNKQMKSSGQRRKVLFIFEENVDMEKVWLFGVGSQEFMNQRRRCLASIEKGRKKSSGRKQCLVFTLL